MKKQGQGRVETGELESSHAGSLSEGYRMKGSLLPQGNLGYPSKVFSRQSLHCQKLKDG